MGAKLPGKTNPWKTNAFSSASITVGTESSNSITCNVQLKNENGGNVGERVVADFYLSDDSLGATPVVTAPNANFGAGSNGAVNALVTGKLGRAVSDASGKFDVVVSDSGAKTVYLVIVSPDGTIAKVSGPVALT